MGKSQRDKGGRVERRILKMFTDVGFKGERVGFLPWMGHKRQGDLEIEGKAYEIKSRKNGAGFKTILDWLGKNYALVLVANNKEPLVVLRISDFLLSEFINKTDKLRNLGKSNVENTDT
jgi:hypothetical protein